MAKRKAIKIVILPMAKTDLTEIVNYIAQGSRRYGLLEKFQIINVIEKLYDNPGLGKPFVYKSINSRQIVLRIT